MNRLKILACVAILCGVVNANAQRNLYYRLDVGSSNIYTFVLSNLVTGYANYFSHDMLFDNSYVYTLYSGKIDGGKIKTKGFDPMGVTARDLFNDAFAGVKLGYQSDFTGPINWGIYASGHYRINQIKAKFPTMAGYGKERFIYLKPGIGLLITFGGVESDVKVQLEAAARYDMPIGYHGIEGTKADDVLNKGVSSHYSVKVGGYSWVSAGVFADFCHYDLYKKDVVAKSNFKPFSFGVTFTITPKRGEDIYK
jgi:hypothetical protein